MKKEEFITELIREADSLGIDLRGEKSEQFYRYYEMLIETNRVMNLTAITEPGDVITKHFLDSLTLVKVLPNLSENADASGQVSRLPENVDASGRDSQLPSNQTLSGRIDGRELQVADLGTGAGFPGIPLKIVFPCLRVTLMDSLGKRIHFLDEVIRELGLRNISAIHGRAEDIGKNPEFREMYDLCVSRAVANMSVLSEYCLPLAKVGGLFVAYKSERAAEEMANAATAIQRLGGKIREVKNFRLSNGDERNLVVIDKVKNTPKKYPRKAGTPAKEPIV
jgi:16S rRNA (guanine527-N7)-methyltransferase